MGQGFPHSQPQSVYRQKNRAMIGLMISLSLALFGFYVYRFVNRTNWDFLLLAGVWLFNLANFSQIFFRNRLVMSPTGISVATGLSRATAWSNVESIRLLALGLGYLIKREVPCLILREPIQGTHWHSLLGVPAELRDRVIPVDPAIWERMFTLEHELYGYLKAHSVIGNELAVPIDFASISQRQTRFVWKFAAAILGLFAFLAIGMVLLMIRFR